MGLESPFQGQAEDIFVEATQVLQESNRAEKELATITGKSIEEISDDLNRNFYLSSDKAVEYGLMDRALIPDGHDRDKLSQGIRDPWSGAVAVPRVGFGEFADPHQPRTAV